MPEIKEECGIFGIYGDPDAVEKTYFGLHSLQHRGQESAGIASSDGDTIHCHTGMGQVARVFRKDNGVLEQLRNPFAIGHVRYSTTGSSTLANAQPFMCEFSHGPVALAHNGNLINAALFRDEYEAHGAIFKTTNDTEIIIHLLAKPSHQNKPDPLGHVLNHLQGAYSLVFLFPDRLEAARDPYGFRPLCIGRTEKGAWVIASETCAFDAIGAAYLRDVAPGEIVTLDRRGMRSRFFVPPGTVKPAHCVFEHVYFAKQSSLVFGDNVHLSRIRCGRQLAIEHPVEADVVIPVPDSGTSAAIGYSRESGIPFDMGFVRSHYVGRTFLSPSQSLRDLGVKMKLTLIREVIRDKRVIVIDDSIVRGTTTKGKVHSIREAGAREVHLRIACPPIISPCFYGVDFPTKEELIASSRTVEEIRRYLQVDSLGYISLPGLLSCMSLPPDHYCTACWSEKYPVPVMTMISKFMMERHQKFLFNSVES